MPLPFISALPLGFVWFGLLLVVDCQPELSLNSQSPCFAHNLFSLWSLCPSFHFQYFGLPKIYLVWTRTILSPARFFLTESILIGWNLYHTKYFQYCLCLELFLFLFITSFFIQSIPLYSVYHIISFLAIILNFFASPSFLPKH